MDLLDFLSIYCISIYTHAFILKLDEFLFEKLSHQVVSVQYSFFYRSKLKTPLQKLLRIREKLIRNCYLMRLSSSRLICLFWPVTCLITWCKRPIRTCKILAGFSHLAQSIIVIIFRRCRFFIAELC
jgi:hypothetical protein